AGRKSAGHAVEDLPVLGLSAAPQPGWLSQPVALHAECAMGVHHARRDGDRAARRHGARVQARRALLGGGSPAAGRELRRRAARPLERAARRLAAGYLVLENLITGW